MSLDGRYDADNIFAKIIRGEIPSVKLFEDDKVLAFMDVFPQSRGHALVISKVSQARNILEVEPEVLSDLAAATQKLTRAVVSALKPDGVVVTQFNGARPARRSSTCTSMSSRATRARRWAAMARAAWPILKNSRPWRGRFPRRFRRFEILGRVSGEGRATNFVRAP